MISTLQRMSTGPDYAATAIAFQRALREFTAWLHTRRTRRALAELSDEQLTDIGLTRGDIDAIARRTARK